MNIKTLVLPIIIAVISIITGGGLDDIHPGYIKNLNIQPGGKKHLVGGIDLFSDQERLVICEWGNPGDVYIFSNIKADDPANITSKRFAMGMQQSLGCKVIGDTVYVMQMGELTQLVDTDSDGVADEYNTINQNFPTSESLLGYAYDLVYLR
ncbi:MAG: hypothetical protein GY869_02775, partial [Planctomycetes bacterium]|nr:hypothetical protein [Planctomycetota bacterium]